MLDVLIIGAGAAGITAAIYAARAELKFEIISKDVGGLTLWSPDIENYPGYHDLNGIELVEKFKEHMDQYDIKVKDDTVEKVEKKDNNFLVKTKEGREYETKTVIVCSGSSPRKLKVDGAEKYEGKGVAYCATCDGPLFKDKDVAVVGGGDSAVTSAQTLLKIANKIHIINRGDELTGRDKERIKKVKESDKVEIINNADTKEILGKDDFVNKLKYEKDGEEKTIDVEGIFVEIGHIRNTDMVKNLIKLNDKNEIIVDESGAASEKGVYAAGDVTSLPGKQTVIACGDGSRTLLTAFDYISKKGESDD
ncbi:FAD-binding protein [Candidatus Woesearchaeota archaeon]|nr:FAD-binding protein [Candidatus Woesearchaeota archaeon]